MNVLVAGATGYIGSRLVPALLNCGHHVRCLVRKNSDLLPPQAEVVHGDVLTAESLSEAFRGVEVAYYLIHSMGAGEAGFVERDRLAAYNFASAAKSAGVKRIVYLGGLGSASLSEHLKSRQETGRVLAAFGPPTLEFRAGIVVGGGSASFEIIRDLAEKLPVMICPAWVTRRVQPIAIADVISYLVAALRAPITGSEVVEIGGGSIETYRSMILGYASVRGLRRLLLKVPVLTPRLSSYWLDLVTAIPPSITRPLIEGLRSEVVCRGNKAQELFPHIHPMNYCAALQRALNRTDPGDFSHELAGRSKALVNKQGLISDCRRSFASVPVTRVREMVQRLGGDQGWPCADWLWQLRGFLDRCVGGVGMRSHVKRVLPLRSGDTLDFWRVQEASERRLLLAAEMKVPGKAWLQFQFHPVESDRTEVRMIASFEPRGAFGFLYWWLLYPLHAIIFAGTMRAIAQSR